MNLSAPLLVIAAGGTGGHMFPAQALAETMLARGWRVKLSTDARGARYTGGFPPAVEIEVHASATFARGGAAAKLLVPFRIVGGTLASCWRMLRDRPDVVVGFGGYPAIPAMAVGTPPAVAWASTTPKATPGSRPGSWSATKPPSVRPPDSTAPHSTADLLTPR